jgi:signal transduction histidine kinase
LRTKLLAVLLVPSLTALALGAFQVRNDYQTANSLDTNSAAVELGNDSAAVVQQLQRERDLTIDFVSANRALPRQPLDQQRAQTDAALRTFQGQIDNARQGPHPDVAERYAAVADQLSRLQSVRTVTDSSNYPADAVLRTYSDSISSLLGLNEQNVTAITNQDLTRLSLAVSSLDRVKEQESVKRATLDRALRNSAFPQNGQRELLAADAERDAALNDFRKWATPQQAQLYSDTVAGSGVDNARNIEETALVRGDGSNALRGLNPDDWFRSSSDAVDLTYQVGNQVRGQLLDQVSQQARAARTQMYLAMLAVILALVVAFALAFLVARSLLLPLRTLRRSALETADTRLPEAVESILHDPNSQARVSPIPVRTKEEIGRVARSFDQVNSQALRLASEQALLRSNINELFVNLARRSQTLVQRQLALIDRLEQDEQDPDQLGSLFELDHLATRMRRNSENLLILGGTDLTRRMMRPVPLSEVIGAAVSEVEQYARVAVEDTPDLAVQGRVVNDFVHLVAELLENATAFSNPDTEVTVRTAYRRQTLILEIRDRGVGIDASELGPMNERLSSPPEIDASISRRMGLYVVAQLARRHDIRVELSNNQDLGGGVTATVHLSGEYVVQLTADGPKPMPDIAQAAEGRDPVADSGTHVGLAAAFGHAGGGASQRSGFDAPTARTELGGDSAAGDPRRVAEGTTDYSVPISSAESFGISAPASGAANGSAPTEEQAGPTREHHGVLGALAGSVPLPDDGDRGDQQSGSPEVTDSGAALFRSPYEAEKTTEFRSTSGEWIDAEDPGSTTSMAGSLGQPPPDRPADDAPTERLPIYEAVLSQWFRESDADDAAERPGLGADFIENQNGEGYHRERLDAPERSERSESGQPRRSGSEQRSGQLPTAGSEDPGWGQADHGWQAAEALVEQVQQAQETTEAGLPKRRPKTNLVPGSVDASSQRSPAPSNRGGVPRSAEAVRGRMSSFQSGIQRGRHAKVDDPAPIEQSSPNPSRPEEQE